VEQIQDGSFEGGRRGSSASDSSTAGSGANAADMQPWEREFGKMTDDFRHTLRGLAKSDDTTAVRSALRLYIDMLEGLYKDIN
jgi:hypothetical protein